jgi:2-keto-4-pentenoate hydratase
MGDAVIRSGMAQVAARLAGARRAGGSLVGWKVGWNDLEFRRKMGVPTGVVGVLLDRSTKGSGTLSLSGTTMPGVEFEVAIRLGERSVRGWTVDAAAPSIELLDVTDTDPARAIGANTWHRAAVIGSPMPWDGPVVQAVTLRATVNGDVLAPVVPPSELLDIDAIVEFVASGASALGEPLAEGQWILCGNLAGRVQWVRPGDQVTASFDGLGDVAAAMT